jgi:hypothetical protein
MSVLTEALKQMLDGLAHQDAGEFLTTSRKSAEFARGTKIKPTQQVVESEPAPVVESRRRIALFIGSDLSPNVMEYITQTCTRMQHDLTVLSFESGHVAQESLAPYREALDAAGIDIRLVTLGGNTISQLVRYLANHPEISFLACKESGYLGSSYVMGYQKKNEMPVPVVVIVERKDAAFMPYGGAVDKADSARTA